MDNFEEILNSLPEKPARSRLEPYGRLINELLRRSRTYREIARILAEKYQITAPLSDTIDAMAQRGTAAVRHDSRSSPFAKRDKAQAHDDRVWATSFSSASFSSVPSFMIVGSTADGRPVLRRQFTRLRKGSARETGRSASGVNVQGKTRGSCRHLMEEAPCSCIAVRGTGFSSVRCILGNQANSQAEPRCGKTTAFGSMFTGRKA